MYKYEFKEEDAYEFARFVGISTKERGNELQFMVCPYCRGGKGGKDKGTFSINRRNGMFKCLRSSCGQQGHMWRLAKDFDFKINNEFTRFYEKKSTYKKLTQPKEKVKPTNAALEYLKSRGISDETAKSYQVTSKKDNESVLCFPVFDENNQLVNIKYRDANFNKDAGGNKEWFEKGCKPYLYGIQTFNGNFDRMILTEGQMDCLSCYESGIENSFSVIGGKNSFTWFPASYQFISKFNEIIIFGDNEHGKITLVEDMRSRFKGIVKHIRVEDYQDCKDANEILLKYGKEQIEKCIDNAEIVPIPQVISLSDVKRVNIYEIEKMETGVKDMDYLLFGGLPFGGVTLLSGKAGEGKSTFASQMMANAIMQGYKVFAYSGELNNSTFKDWFDMQVAGPDHIFEEKDRWGLPIYKISDTNRNQIEKWYDGKFFLYNNMAEENDGKSLVETIEDVILQYGVQVIFVDNLMTALDLEPRTGSDKFEKQSLFVKRLTRLALKYNVLIVLIAHKRKNNFSTNENDEVMGSSDITNLAMVTIAYEKDSDIDESQRICKVSKNRLFGKVNTKGWTLNYDDKSKRIYGSENELNKSFGWDQDDNGFIQVEDLTVFGD